MLRITRSLPDECPDCGSSKLGGKGAIEMGGNSLICHDCGIFMVVPDREEDEEEGLDFLPVVADLVSCRHCGTMGRMEEAGGQEWCASCGLDPNIDSYPSPEIAHLWSNEGGIQRALERDLKPLQEHRRIGLFLRNDCGPHCEYAADCPQSIKNLMECLKESEGKLPDYDMGKRKKRKKEKQKQAKQSGNPFKSEPHRAMLICSKSGWLEERMYDKAAHRKQSGASGS